MPRVGVAISTYGDRDVWDPLVERAVASVRAQTSNDWVWNHLHGYDGQSLHEVRNTCAQTLIRVHDCEYLLFLDADDELHPEFIDKALLSARLSTTKWPVIQPSTLGVVDGVEDDEPFMIPSKNLLEQNYLIIGCLHKADMFKWVGGFDDWAMMEDWAYWLKAWCHGATFAQAPEAIYRVHIDSNRVSRNQTVSNEKTAEMFTKIRAMYTLLARQRGLA